MKITEVNTPKAPNTPKTWATIGSFHVKSDTLGPDRPGFRSYLVCLFSSKVAPQNCIGLNLTRILREKQTRKGLHTRVGHYTFSLDYISPCKSQKYVCGVVWKLFSGSTYYTITLEYNYSQNMNYDKLKN